MLHWGWLTKYLKSLVKTAKKDVCLVAIFFLKVYPLIIQHTYARNKVGSSAKKHILTLTPVIILFLQQEVSIFAGVTCMPTCIRLTVTLSTFLCKQTIKRWLMLQMFGYSNFNTTTWKHSPVHTLQHHSESLSGHNDTLEWETKMGEVMKM